MKRLLCVLLALLMMTGSLSLAESDKPVPGKITVMVFDRGNVPSSEGNAANNRWTQWVKDHAPVEVEFLSVARAEADQILVHLFATGKAPDYIPYGSNPQAFVTNGMCLEITDDMLQQVPNYLKRIAAYPEADKAATFSGVRYGFGYAENVFHNHNIVIRKDWLDNLGLSIPTTTDELLNIMQAFTIGDPDGNGLHDTWGTSLTGDSQRIYAHMWGFPWPEKYVEDGEGSVVYAWDRMEAWLDFCKTIVNSGYMNPDFMLMKGDDDRVDFLNGRIGIYGQARFANPSSGSSLYRDFMARNPEAELVSFALPATEYGQYTAYINGGVSFDGFINPKTENLKGVLAYVNWLMEPEVEEYLSFGPLGEYYAKSDDGTYYAVASADRIEDELAWSPFYDATIKLNGDETDRFANDQYNQYLISGDPVTQQYGALFYQLSSIANATGASDPRKWQQFLPVLPSDLQAIKVRTNAEVDAILKAALINPRITAAEAVANARQVWIDAGGERVDAFYAEYYASAGDTALRMSDFDRMKAMPRLTDAARSVYEQLSQ